MYLCCTQHAGAGGRNGTAVSRASVAPQQRIAQGLTASDVSSHRSCAPARPHVKYMQFNCTICAVCRKAEQRHEVHFDGAAGWPANSTHEARCLPASGARMRRIVSSPLRWVGHGRKRRACSSPPLGRCRHGVFCTLGTVRLPPRRLSGVPCAASRRQRLGESNRAVPRVFTVVCRCLRPSEQDRVGASYTLMRRTLHVCCNQTRWGMIRAFFRYLRPLRRMLSLAQAAAQSAVFGRKPRAAHPQIDMPALLEVVLRVVPPCTQTMQARRGEFLAAFAPGEAHAAPPS